MLVISSIVLLIITMVVVGLLVGGIIPNPFAEKCEEPNKMEDDKCKTPSEWCLGPNKWEDDICKTPSEWCVTPNKWEDDECKTPSEWCVAPNKWEDDECQESYREDSDLAGKWIDHAENSYTCLDAANVDVSNPGWCTFKTEQDTMNWCNTQDDCVGYVTNGDIYHPTNKDPVDADIPGSKYYSKL